MLPQSVKKTRKSAFFSLYSVENVMLKYQNSVLVITELRQPRWEEGEREGGAKEEEKKRKTVEGENQASHSRAYAYARAFQPQCCFFAVTSVTLAITNEEKLSENAEKMRSISGRNPREYLHFSMSSCVFLEDSIDVLLKYVRK